MRGGGTFTILAASTSVINARYHNSNRGNQRPAIAISRCSEQKSETDTYLALTRASRRSVDVSCAR